MEIIGRVERDCSLSCQRIIPYGVDFGEVFVILVVGNLCIFVLSNVWLLSSTLFLH